MEKNKWMATKQDSKGWRLKNWKWQSANEGRLCIQQNVLTLMKQHWMCNVDKRTSNLETPTKLLLLPILDLWF
jgi:hypothetical protein